VTADLARTYRLHDVLDTPLDVDAHLAGIPEYAAIKGYFALSFYEYVDRHAPDAVAAYQALYPRRPAPTADVPAREFGRRLVDAARLAHPDQPLTEGLRRIGRSIYASARGSLLGRAILHAQGPAFDLVASQAPRAYEVFEKYGCVIRFERVGERHFRYDLDPGRPFLGSYHVGILEGAAMAFDVEPTITVELDGEYRGSITCRW
jgi:uncharacterized protein (TIGR02265 family)